MLPLLTPASRLEDLKDSGRSSKEQVASTSAGKPPKDESAAAAGDKYRYLPNYYKVKGSEHFADSSSSMVEC